MKKVITLGPLGSFSAYGTQAWTDQVLPESELVLETSFHNVWKKILAEPDLIGVLPIENSSTSNVHENIDFVFRHPNIKILGEFFLPITLNLYGPTSETIETLDEIFSHPKAFEQCESFLTNFTGTITEMQSTSDALDFFAQKSGTKKIGFIGGPQLADMTQATLLQADIANQCHNVTRFLIMSQSEPNLLQKPDASKATLVFETFHEKGALAKVLTLISHLDGNLLKIESRPIPHKPNNYAFWVDIDLTHTPENLIDILRKNVQDLRVVGRYTAGQTLIF